MYVHPNLPILPLATSARAFCFAKISPEICTILSSAIGMAAAADQWNGWNAYQDTASICPEYVIIKPTNERVPAPWPTFVPTFKTKAAHWVCELCALKNGAKKQVDENHLGTAQHQNRIGK